VRQLPRQRERERERERESWRVTLNFLRPKHSMRMTAKTNTSSASLHSLRAAVAFVIHRCFPLRGERCAWGRGGTSPRVLNPERGMKMNFLRPARLSQSQWDDKYEVTTSESRSVNVKWNEGAERFCNSY
jgi:hypothetical protein